MHQLPPVHIGHAQIRDHDIDMLGVEHLQSLGRTGMRAGRIALIGQGQADKIGQPAFIIHDHHTLHLRHDTNSGKIISKHAPRGSRAR